jgi:hypothetical protein
MVIPQQVFTEHYEILQFFIIIIIIMFTKGLACYLFLNPEGEVGPSISS